MIAFTPRVAVPVSALVFLALTVQHAGLPGMWSVLVVVGFAAAGLSAMAFLTRRTAEFPMMPVPNARTRRIAAEDASDLVRMDSDAG